MKCENMEKTISLSEMEEDEIDFDNENLEKN